jgi:predicted flap endonuclease-1-like 5' DNA nuclease
MTALKDIKGMTEAVAAKLKELGIDSSDELLAAANTPVERKELAVKLGIDPKLVLELANRSDLIRIKGVAGAFSDLLENAGVDTVKELAGRVPENLQAKLEEVNAKMKISQRTPTVEMVSEWVEQAKQLPKGLEY